jgi:predicted secreted protein
VKHYSYIFIVFTTWCLAFAACKKDNSPNMKTISLTTVNSGTTVAAVKGQAITLTLSNPGDGGYQFNEPQFDAAILKLNSHTHLNATTNTAGNFGNDTWTFTALGGGTSPIIILASRGSVDVITIFSSKVSVR